MYAPNFEVTDRVNVYITGNDKIEGIAKNHLEEIKGDVLAENLTFAEAKGFTKEWNVNGENVTIGVEK